MDIEIKKKRYLELYEKINLINQELKELDEEMVILYNDIKENIIINKVPFEDDLIQVMKEDYRFLKNEIDTVLIPTIKSIL